MEQTMTVEDFLRKQLEKKNATGLKLINMIGDLTQKMIKDRNYTYLADLNTIMMEI